MQGMGMGAIRGKTNECCGQRPRIHDHLVCGGLVLRAGTNDVAFLASALKTPGFVSEPIVLGPEYSIVFWARVSNDPGGRAGPGELPLEPQQHGPHADVGPAEHGGMVGGVQDPQHHLRGPHDEDDQASWFILGTCTTYMAMTARRRGVWGVLALAGVAAVFCRKNAHLCSRSGRR